MKIAEHIGIKEKNIQNLMDNKWKLRNPLNIESEEFIPKNENLYLS